jgi:hypothetical protein
MRLGVDHDRAGACEHERESTDQLRNQRASERALH